MITNSDPQFVNDTLAKSWEDYCDTLKIAGQLVLTSATPHPALDQPEGLRMLTRLMRYGLESGLEFSDADFPVFYQPSHETLKIMSDNPDTLHFMATIRADADYEISCTRGLETRLVFTTLARAPDSAALVLQSGVSADGLRIDANGSFTLRVSQTPQPGNWLVLKPGAQSLLVRAIFLDRHRQITPVLTIRRLNGPAVPPDLDETLFSARLKMSALLCAGTARAMIGYADKIRARGWINTFGVDPTLWGAGDPGAHYHHGSWALNNDEALVIEFKPPECFFWNLQINNPWTESLDYTHRKIHVNKASAVAGVDGTVKVVVAKQDPGMPNWLDVGGHRGGSMLARWIDATHSPDIQCTVMKLETKTENLTIQRESNHDHQSGASAQDL